EKITKMAGPVWLEYKKPEEPVTTVSLTGEKVADAVLPELKAFVNLRELRLTRAVVSNEGLGELAGLQRLAVLRVNQCTKLTGESLKSLRGVSSLREIWMEGVKVTTEDLKALAALPNLKLLLLLYANINDAGLAELSKLTRLESLFLEGNQLT